MIVKITPPVVTGRLVFDEICANFLTLSENRRRVKKEKIKFLKKNYQTKF